MLKRAYEYLAMNPGSTSFSLCEKFGLSRGMSERLLATLEDAGLLTTEIPQSGCSSGGG